MQNINFSLKRIPASINKFGVAKSTWYAWVKLGLMTPGISLGARSVGWPDFELDAILAARIAGKSEGEIKELIKKLIADRQSI